jgi:hypothetical protein
MALHPAPTIDDRLCLITQPLRHASVGRDALCTFSALAAGGETVQDIADDFQDNWNTNIAPTLDNNVLSLPPSVKLGDGTNVPAFSVGTGAAVAGTFSAADLPPQVAVLIKKVTGFGGKKNRGRFYLPWAVPGSVVNERGTILAANVTAMQANMTLFLEQMATDGFPMYISNKVLVLTPPDTRPHVTAIHTGHLVLNLRVEDVVATQRRRLPR